jgi:TrpR-related protein YerC/YecD
MKAPSKHDIDKLYGAVLKLETVAECHRFFRDLMTEHEINECAERWKAARMLSAGMTYDAIQQETGLSSRTIARIHKWMKEGRGGYAMMLQRTGQS